MVVILTFGRWRQLTIIKYGACPGQDFRNAFSPNHFPEELRLQLWTAHKVFNSRPKSVSISSIIWITVFIFIILRLKSKGSEYLLKVSVPQRKGKPCFRGNSITERWESGGICWRTLCCIYIKVDVKLAKIIISLVWAREKPVCIPCFGDNIFWKKLILSESELVFSSDRSSRNANVCPSVHSRQVCLEFSFFISQALWSLLEVIRAY